MQNLLKKEIQHVISGKSQVRFGAAIQTVASYLSTGTKPSTSVKGTKSLKQQETKRLETFATEHNLWITDIDFTQYVSEGAEQRVYLKDTNHVLKLNDSIYYNSWVDYFHNLLLHNFFFEDTAYTLRGFAKEDQVLYAVVEQAYVSMTDKTDLGQLKKFLHENGFMNTRNNDYFNHDLQVILEDLHDENVLTRNNVLYFIDTVFYLTDEFWLDMKLEK